MPYKNLGAILDQMVAGTITPVIVNAAHDRLQARSTSVSARCPPSQRRSRSTSRRPTAATTRTRTRARAHGRRVQHGDRGILMSLSNWMAKDETTPATTPAGAALASASYAASDDVWSHSTRRSA
jgi:hypothetical protein